jgi:predicted RNA-binding protein with PUA-like domain
MTKKQVRYWLLKTEPETYSFDDLTNEPSHGTWDGVRNYQARNNLRAMEVNDLLLIYHSVSDKEIVGIAKVTKTAFPDPTAESGDWSAIELKSVKKLNNPVSLEKIKNTSGLSNMPLIKHSRLSVMPVDELEYKIILDMSKKG